MDPADLTWLTCNTGSDDGYEVLSSSSSTASVGLSQGGYVIDETYAHLQNGEPVINHSLLQINCKNIQKHVQLIHVHKKRH